MQCKHSGHTHTSRGVIMSSAITVSCLILNSLCVCLPQGNDAFCNILNGTLWIWVLICFCCIILSAYMFSPVFYLSLHCPFGRQHCPLLLSFMCKKLTKQMKLWKKAIVSLIHDSTAVGALCALFGHICHNKESLSACSNAFLFTETTGTFICIIFVYYQSYPCRNI